MNKTLQKLLAESSALDKEETADQQRLVALAVEEKQLIESAPSADDERTLEKLAVNASQTTIVRRRIRVREQGKTGLRASILNEALRVKTATNTKVDAAYQREISRLDSSLSPFLPSDRQRRQIIDEIAGLSPALRLNRKRRISLLLGDVGGDEIKFGEQVCSSAEYAFTDVLDPEKK